MNNLEKETMEMAKRAAKKFVYDEVNWEQRRYEIAKDVLCAIISSDNHNEITLDCVTAVNIADALIKELKGGKPCE